MTSEKILWRILDVFKECNVDSFPINCYKLLEHYGYECKEYSELEENKQLACLMVSDDAFRLRNEVYYNDAVQRCRSRFSLAHELGHIILRHKAPYTNSDECEANFFAGNILAPRMAIHYARCKNANDVSKIFQISYEAASYAFDDYRRWRRKAIYRMTPLDKAMYSHFYNSEKSCFVWNKKECAGKWCRTILYNTTDTTCPLCKIYRKPEVGWIPITSAVHNTWDGDHEDFMIAECQWLYGNDL